MKQKQDQPARYIVSWRSEAYQSVASHYSMDCEIHCRVRSRQDTMASAERRDSFRSIIDRTASNRLASESSPYLRQHANNPVDWYPWGPEAFSRAKAEDKPILLSIGYSACHWCHVMAHESFENAEIAALYESAFHQHQSGSRRTSGSRRHLPEICPGLYRSRRRMAAHHVSDARRKNPSMEGRTFPRCRVY